MADVLPVRPCIGCGGSDDHPRHEVVIGDGNHTSVFWHMDCHVLATACSLCAQQIEGAGGVKGHELRAHLVSLPPRVEAS